MKKRSLEEWLCSILGAEGFEEEIEVSKMTKREAVMTIMAGIGFLCMVFCMGVAQSHLWAAAVLAVMAVVCSAPWLWHVNHMEQYHD